MDDNELFDVGMECPHGAVEGIMRRSSEGVLKATPTETLEAIIPRLSQVTGLPVLDASGRVIGAISRKDIIKVRKANGSLLDTVSQHMATPAITVGPRTSVREAADLMLAKRIRRLPVVDTSGRPLGIVSRTDIFKPLLAASYQSYQEAELAALRGAPGSTGAVAAPPAPPAPASVASASLSGPSWQIKYLFDGDCPMCQSLKAVLERQDEGKGRIKFVDIAADDYDPLDNMGIECDEAMQTIHAILPDGEVLYGTDALRAMFELVGLGWAVRLSAVPIVAMIVDAVYEFLSANRLQLSGMFGGLFDAIIAAKRIELSKGGVDTCGDIDEGCLVEW